MSRRKNVSDTKFVSEIGKAHLKVRMERRDHDTICNPPHQIRPRCVYLFLNQLASTRASIWTSEEEGLFIACVAGVESGRGLGGREKGEKGWGETVRDPFPFSCRPYLQTLPFLRKPRRLACLLGWLLKDSVALSNLCPSDTTKKQGYFVLTNFYLHNILFQRNTPLLCEMLAFRGFHRDVQRQSIVQRQQQAV